MRDLLKILKFDVDMERFAEVFGDNIESEDINGFLKVAPLTSAELEKARESDLFYTVGTPEGEFEALDLATQSKLNTCRESAGLEPQSLALCRAFFRFVNDAYGWEDLGDLERWEEELFNSLNGYQQKNYKPLDLEETEQSRFDLFLKFNRYLKESYGEEVAFKVLQTAKDDLSPREKLGLNLGLI